MTSSLGERGSTRRWRQLRAQVLTRDGGVCWLCGEGGADSVDHVLPRYQGGGDNEGNLAAAHLGCNQRRERVVVVPKPSRSW